MVTSNLGLLITDVLYDLQPPLYDLQMFADTLKLTTD